MGGVGVSIRWRYIFFPPPGGMTLSMAFFCFSSRLLKKGSITRGNIIPPILIRGLMSVDFNRGNIAASADSFFSVIFYLLGQQSSQPCTLHKGKGEVNDHPTIPLAL